MRTILTTFSMVLMICISAMSTLAIDAKVAGGGEIKMMRVPNGGIQPQVTLDGEGTIHLIYFKGDAQNGNVLYVRSTDAGETFSKPIRVNSHENSAVVTGTIRGAHLAVGKDNRPHVAWMGSQKAMPKAPNNQIPMLYTRLNDAGDAFEPQKNVIHEKVGLDGGGSVAADDKGNVYVMWHAPDQGDKEADRQVWVARSSNEGKTFAPETAAFNKQTGACACCGMRAVAGKDGSIYVLYRSASEMVNRDIYLLRSSDDAKSFAGEKAAPWKIGKCVMSTAMLVPTGDSVLAAWESQEQVQFAEVAADGIKGSPISAPGTGKNRKYPAIARNGKGQTLLVWTEGTRWNKGGSMMWQLFDQNDQPISTQKGQSDGVPPWSLVAVFSRPDGGFTIIY